MKAKAGIVALLILGCLITPAAARRACTRPLGTSGADTLFGTFRKDVLCGRAGADTIDSSTGKDVIRGGSGDDTLDVQDGEANDLVRGGHGLHDTCYGDTGDRFRQCEIVVR